MTEMMMWMPEWTIEAPGLAHLDGGAFFF